MSASASNRGEIFCIMGLSGSGKSTLVRHFNRLLEPTAGKIEIEGTDVMALGTRDLQRPSATEKIGMVFQNFALMPHRSVLDNVAMPLEIRKVAKNERMRQAAAILDIVELGAWGSKFAHELSGGMQQRVGLARALAANPDVLLMDEPFSALDPLIRRQLQDEFIRLSKILKKTTIFITHDLDEAVRIGDRIAIMRDGKMVQIGTRGRHRHEPGRRIRGGLRGRHLAPEGRARPCRHATDRGRMCPRTAASLQTRPRVDEDETLSTLINIAIDEDHPIVVQDAGRDVGVITRADLLKTVIEGTEVS